MQEEDPTNAIQEDLEKNEIRERMIQLLPKQDSRCAIGQKWMAPEHERQLIQLNPFEDKEMDLLLRDILRRQGYWSSSELGRHFDKRKGKDYDFTPDSGSSCVLEEGC